MALPNPFAAPKPVQRFLTVVVADGRVQAALASLEQGHVELLSHSGEKTFALPEEAVLKTDESLQELGKLSEEVNEVVFGLVPEWVKDNDIADAHKPLLKKITEDLGLHGLGFVVTTEALTQFLVKSDPRFSALLLDITPKQLFLSVLHHGKVTHTMGVGRSDQLVADVTEALARLTTQQDAQLPLPSKIIVASAVLDQTVLHREQQQLLNHEWNQQWFLQPPVVEVMGASELLTAVVQEGGRAVAAHLGVPVVSSDSSSVPSSGESDAALTAATGAVSMAERAASSDVERAVETPASAVGTSFGIPLSISQLPKPPQAQSHQSHTPGHTLAEDDDDHIPLSRRAQLKRWFLHHKLYVLSGFVGGLLTLGILGYLWLALGASAQITVALDKKSLSKDVLITLAATGESDPEKLILAAQAVSEEVTGSKTVATTGIKLVGEKASGTVKLFNKTEAEKTFEAGTHLSLGGLTYTLSENVTIASSSVKRQTGSESKEYGSADVTVTATAIGSEANQSKGVELTVANFSKDTYSATVGDGGLSGGASREIRVVAEVDKQTALKELKAELLKQGTKQLQEAAAVGTFIAPASTVTTVDAVYDAEVGAEANNLTLALTAKVSTLSYAATDLKPLAQAALSSEIPDGYILADEDPQILSSVDEAASSSGTVKLAANLRAVTVPNIAADELKQEILGKTIADAQQLLESKDTIAQVKIVFRPALAGRITAKLPKNPAKIEVVVE